MNNKLRSMDSFLSKIASCIFTLFILLNFSSHFVLASPQEQPPKRDDQSLLKPNYIDIYSKLTTDTSTVRRGGTIEYTFTFINIGSETPKDIVFTFYAPNQGQPVPGNYVRNFQQIGVSQGIVYDTTTYADEGNIATVKWTMAELSSPDSQRIVFSVDADSLNESRALTGVMALVCPGFSNSNSAEVTLILTPQLTISKYVDPSGGYKPGSQGVYYLKVCNNGQRGIDSVLVYDELSQHIIVDLAGIIPDEYSIDNNICSWNIDMLNPGDSVLYSIPFMVNPGFQVTSNPAESRILNTAHAEAGIYRSSASISFLVTAADIEATITPKLDDYSPGYPLTLEGVIQNIGISAIGDPFRVGFFLEDTSKQNQIGEDFIFDTLSVAEGDIEPVSVVWENPPEGLHRIILFADHQNDILEIDEMNNLDTMMVSVRITELDVRTNVITYFENSDPIYDMSPFYPDSLFAYVAVMDQNFHPVRGIASRTGWVSGDQQTDAGESVRSVWYPIYEFPEGAAEPYPSVYTTGVAPFVTQIAEQDQWPVTATFVVPTSSAGVISAIKDSLCSMVEKFNEAKDQVAVVSYSNHVENVLELTGNFEDACSALRESNSTSPAVLMDAIYRGIAESAQRPGRRAVIVLTDGNNTSFLTRTQVMDYSMKMAVPIILLNYGTADQTELKILAETCGGYYQELSSAETEFFEKLFELLTNYYLVAYKSPNRTMEGTIRNFDVTINYPKDPFPVGTDTLGRYLAPVDNNDLWLEVASFPSGLAVEKHWKTTNPEETYDYVLSILNTGNDRLNNITIENLNSQYVTITEQSTGDDRSVWQNQSLNMGERRVLTLPATVDSELPYSWLSVIDSAAAYTADVSTAANDTVWIIQDVAADIRVSQADVAEYPSTKKAERFLFACDSERDSCAYNIKFWVQLPMNVSDFSIIVYDALDVEQNFTEQITNMPQFPTLPDTISIEPFFSPTGKVTETDEEKWVARLSYTDELGNQGASLAEFYLVAENKLILNRNVVDLGNDVLVSIELTKDSPVDLNVYNVAGEHVRTLVENRQYPIGFSEVDGGWDCKDKNGRLVGSGVYIVTMEAGGRTTWQKVIVVR